MAERLALPTSDHGVAGSNPAGGEILPEPKRRFMAHSLSCSPFHRLEMTEILFKGRKTLTHPSILNLGGRRGTTEDVATIPFHPSLSSAALRESPNLIPVHSLMLSSHLFFCLPLLLAHCPLQNCLRHVRGS